MPTLFVIRLKHDMIPITLASSEKWGLNTIVLQQCCSDGKRHQKNMYPSTHSKYAYVHAAFFVNQLGTIACDICLTRQSGYKVTVGIIIRAETTVRIQSINMHVGTTKAQTFMDWAKTEFVPTGTTDDLNLHALRSTKPSIWMEEVVFWLQHYRRRNSSMVKLTKLGNVNVALSQPLSRCGEQILICDLNLNALRRLCVFDFSITYCQHCCRT